MPDAAGGDGAPGPHAVESGKGERGIPNNGLLVFGINPQLEGRKDDKAIAFYRGLMEKLRPLPQVESVTLMGNRLASGWSNNTNAVVDGNT